MEELLGADEPQNVDGTVTENTETPEIQKEEKTVPLQALHEERNRRKQLQQEVEQLRHQQDEIREAIQKRKQAEEPQAPDFNDDPAGHLNHQIIETNKKLDEFSKFKQNFEEFQTNQQKTTQFQQHINSLVQTFTQQHPDYPDAYNFMRNERIKELQASGLDHQAISNALMNEEVFIAQQSLSNELNPAEAIYNMAKSRGYSNGSNEVSAPKQPTSLGNTGGAGPIDGFSTEDIEKLSDDEFGKFWDKFSKNYG